MPLQETGKKKQENTKSNFSFSHFLFLSTTCKSRLESVRSHYVESHSAVVSDAVIKELLEAWFLSQFAYELKSLGAREEEKQKNRIEMK